MKPSSNTGDPRLVAVLAVAAVVFFGLSVWLYLSERAPGDGSPEAGFARDMSVHHAQAVEMADIVRDRTESEEIKILATDIVLTQQAQIGMMQGWLDVWGLPASGTEPAMSWMGHSTGGRMPGMATSQEITRLREAPPEEADEQFLWLMIRHHRAAIPMAEAILHRTDRPEVEELAEAIAASQRQEIHTMKAMSREHMVNFARIAFEPVGASGLSGTATFEEVDGGVRVDLDVKGLPKPGTTYLAHIHSGTCAGGEKGGGHEHGEDGQHHEERADGSEGHGAHMGTEQLMRNIEAPLTPVEADAKGQGSSTTVVRNTTVDGLFSFEPEYVNVHAAGSKTPSPLGCADLDQ